MIFLLFFLSLLIGFTPVAHCALEDAGQEIKIGVLAHRGFERTLQMWEPTATYLTETIPGYTFKVLPLTNDDIERMVNQSKVDFVLTNPASYAVLEAQYGVSRLATLRNLAHGRSYTVFGAVIFTRADRNDIKTLEDLKDKSFMAVHRNAFGGWWMAWREMQDRGIKPFKDLAQIKFVGFPQDQIVYAVRDGKVDAGTVRTSLLERMSMEGKIDLRDFRILSPRKTLYFSYLHSTQLYPEWPFATVKHTPYALAQQVAIALLNLPSEHVAAKSAKIAGWTVPLDYQPVLELMQELRVGPYENFGEITTADVFMEYWAWILGFTVALTLMALTTMYILALNRRLQDTNTQLQSEITERTDLEQKLKHQALHDSLTNLPNRALFSDRLQQSIYSGEREHTKFAVAVVDLDNFKEINDSMGHQVGDKLLRQVAELFQNVLRKTDTIARLGGDEFAILFKEIEDQAAATNMVLKCLATLDTPIKLDNHECLVNASVGIARYPEDGLIEEVLMRHADIAMYKSKRTGCGVSLYEPDLDQTIKTRFALQHDLRAAISNKDNALGIYFQPRINCVSEKITGFEAVARWHHPKKGLLLPQDFIPVAEQSGLLNQLNAIMLDKAFHRVKDLHNQGYEIKLSVNVSPRTLTSQGFAGRIADLLKQFNISASNIEIEITESMVFVDPERVVDACVELKKLGIFISIDNFGVNYLSLDQLAKLPVDGLKIDRSFVRNILRNEKDLEIVKSAIRLGQTFGLWVVAEGVEDKQIWQQIKGLGCDFAQGFYISEPVAGGQLINWLQDAAYGVAVN
jgi:diguanylate cyclase (GGDEF)-like protein